MVIVVWMDAWQMQCCGTSFSLGDDVSWTTVPPDREWLSMVLGPDGAAGIDASEEHHDDLDETTATAVGTVTEINVVHCRFGPLTSVNNRGLYPISGSGVRTPVTHADWGNRADAGFRFAGAPQFVGYVVRLAVPEEH